MKVRLLKLALVFSSIYLLLVLGMTGCQRSMIYFPQQTDAALLLRQASAAGLEPWLNVAGERIGWQRPAKQAGPAPAVLVFHGNAGHAAHRSYFADAFGNPANTGGSGWHVYLLEYPGYGSRSGRPTETSLCDAGREALAEVAREGRHPVIYLLGESLGTGVACQIAAGEPELVDGLLLISPFPSLTKVAKAHISWLPVGLILLDRYNSSMALQSYHGPVAVVIAGDDEVIPPALSERLHEDYAGPKRRWVQPGARHNSMNLNADATWWREVVGFWQPAVAADPGPAGAEVLPPPGDSG